MVVALSDRFCCTVVKKDDVGNGDDNESAGTPELPCTYEMNSLVLSMPNERMA